MKKFYFIALAIFAASLLIAPTAMADDMYCRDMVLGGYYDNVIVPYGKWCVLDDAKLKGNFQAEGAKAIVIKDSKIDGNIQIKNTKYVPSETDGFADDYKKRKNIIVHNIVAGDVQLSENKAGFAIKRNKVYGNIQVEKSCLRERMGVDYEVRFAIAIKKNTVYGDLQFFENCSEYGVFIIKKNMVWENLQCDKNDPAPIYKNNIVYGDTQCYDYYYDCESCFNY